MAKMHFNPSQRRREVEEVGKTRIWVNYGQVANFIFVEQNRDWILDRRQNIWTTFGRPIAGVSCPRAERRPQRAAGTHRYGATWPMECTSSAAGTAAAASVSTVPPCGTCRGTPRLR